MLVHLFAETYAKWVQRLQIAGKISEHSSIIIIIIISFFKVGFYVTDHKYIKSMLMRAVPREAFKQKFILTNTHIFQI